MHYRIATLASSFSLFLQKNAFWAPTASPPKTSPLVKEESSQILKISISDGLGQEEGRSLESLPHKEIASNPTISLYIQPIDHPPEPHSQKSHLHP